MVIFQWWSSGYVLASDIPARITYIPGRMYGNALLIVWHRDTYSTHYWQPRAETNRKAWTEHG